MKYDYDIRETFDAILGKDSLWNINNEISDNELYENGNIKESNTLTTCLLSIKEILKEQGAI